MPLTTAALTATAAILLNVLIIAILLDRDVDTTDGRKGHRIHPPIPRYATPQAHSGQIVAAMIDGDQAAVLGIVVSVLRSV